MKRKISNVAASVHARLLNKAKKQGRPFNEILQYYAMERFLYRLARSQYGKNFVLKGALALRKYGGPITRTTKDIDLLGRDTGTVGELVATLKECLAVKVQDDGVQFDPETARGEEIRIDAEYIGVRVRFHGHLGTAKLTLQVDVGFGDVVVPDPVEFLFPTLLDSDRPQLLAYAAESIVAEKLEAMLALDMANTRLKDFADLWTLALGTEFSGPLLL